MLNIVDVLHGCELFSGIPPAGFRRLAAIAQLRHFRKGQMVFREGDPCPGVYVVGQGQVRIFKTGAGGKEHVLHLVNPGGTFAEAAALGDFPMPASAEALKKTTCALLPLERFRGALLEDNALCLGMMAGLCGWVRRFVALLEDLTLRDAAGRMARLFLELAQTQSAADGIIELPGMKRHVASHLVRGDRRSRVQSPDRRNRPIAAPSAPPQETTPSGRRVFPAIISVFAMPPVASACQTPGRPIK